MISRTSSVAPVAAPKTRPAPNTTDGTNDLEKSVPGWPEDRSYRIHFPKNYDPATPTPVVMALHGFSHDAAKMERITSPNGDPTNPQSLDSLADREGFAVIYPNGTPLKTRAGRAWNAGGGQNGYAPIAAPEVGDHIHDVKYLNDVLDDAAKVLNTDKSRVYATGISNGGAMAYRIAVQMCDRLAAVGVVAAGNQYSAAINGGEPARNVPLVVMHGEDDQVWPINGGEMFYGKMASIPGSVEQWAEWNQAKLVNDTTLEDKNIKDGTRVELKSYRGATPNSDVDFYTVHGGGHAWPDGQQFTSESHMGKVTRDVNANEVMWNFFKGHKLEA